MCSTIGMSLRMPRVFGIAEVVPLPDKRVLILGAGLGAVGLLAILRAARRALNDARGSVDDETPAEDLGHS